MSLAAVPARAGTFTHLNSGLNAANSGPYITDGPRREVRGEVAHSDLTASQVCFRYRSIIAIDRGGPGQVESEGATSSYWIEFGVTENAGQPWTVQLASHRRGDCNIINDFLGTYADAEVVTQLSATYTIDNLNPGTLSALQFPTYSATNEDDSSNPAHTNIEDSATAFVTGFGNGGEQIVRVNFTWSTNVISHGGLAGGDEAAVRLGLSTTGLERISAGDYPGSPARNIDYDGHFVCVTFCAQPATSITASSTTTCLGSPVTLTAVGGSGVSAQWFKDCCCGTALAGTGTSIVVNPTTTSTYFVRWLSDSCGSNSCDPNPEIPGCGPSPCSPGITIQVVTPPSPPAVVTATSTDVCAGTVVTLSSSGGSGAVQRWFTGSCGGTPLASTGTTILVTPLVTTTYYTRWESTPCAPTACAQITINVTQPPTAPTALNASSTSICSGDSVTLTAVGGSGTTRRWYSGSCGGTVVAGTTASISVSPTTTTTYFVQWESPPCPASACATVTVTVTPPPQPPTLVTADTNNICSGSSVLLSAFGGSGTTLRWYAGACGSSTLVGTGATISVSPTTTTTYHARWDSPPCALSACSPAVVITVSPGNSPPTSAIASDADICAGTGVILSALGGSGSTLHWYADACGGAPVGTGTSIAVSPATSTRYYARWESATCPASPCASVDVTVSPVPVAPTAITASSNPSCAGSPVILTAVGASGGIVRWYLNSCGGSSIGTGPTITVSPTGTATYFARSETVSCGDSNCAALVITVNAIPVAPTSATASNPDICAGESTVLSVVGGSGQVLQWRAGSCTAPLLYSGPALGFQVSPSTTTTYFASWSASGCLDSACVSVTVNVSTPPLNDDCVQAIDLFAATSPASLITNFTTRCATTDGPAHNACSFFGDPLIGQDVWFRYHAPLDGSLRLSTCYPAVTGFDTRIAVYRGLACPVDDARLMTCQDDSGAGCAPGTTVNIRVDPGQDYLIRVGGRGGSSGAGQLLSQLTVSTPCPPPGPPIPQTFSLCGTATNVTWQWRIRSVDGVFVPILGTAGPVSTGGTAYDLAVAFKNSIDAAVSTLPGGCAGNLTTTALLIGLTNCGGAPTGSGGVAGLTVSCSVAIELSVFDTTMADWCVLDSDPNTTMCQFNPFAEQVPLPGIDCNLNGIEDVIDIFLGTSADVDGNQIPDECLIPAGTTFCFGDGSSLGCPCGNNAPLGTHGGCMNSLGLSGRLVGTGVPSITFDSLRLSGEGMPNSSALYFQGTTQTGAAFGDGLRCAGGAVIRLGTKLNSGNASTYPSGTDVAISVKGLVTTPGSVRRYQVWYRNAAPFCTGSTFNLTNGVSVTWGQ